MEDVEVALVIAISIIAVLIASIWWATRTKKRQAESAKPVKIPLPQDDLRAARNRFYQQKEKEKQPPGRQESETEPTEPSKPIQKGKKRDRMYSFATLRNSWENKDVGGSTNSTPVTSTFSDIPEEPSKTSNKTENPDIVPQAQATQESTPVTKPAVQVHATQESAPVKKQAVLQAQATQESASVKKPAEQAVEKPSKLSGNAKVKEEASTDPTHRRSSLLIQPIKQKVIHYKYTSLPRARVTGLGYDESGQPIIQPIKSFYKLLSWLPGFDNFNVPCVPLRHRGNTKPDVKVLLCHDMMGGYTLDKYPQGVNVMEDYHFYHWHLIEGFIYFSHNFITIPPATWTNAAHANGVLSMGTIITEWEDGTQTCNHLLSTSDNVEKFVEQCVSLANYYQFDGWLVNIENSLQPDQVGMLLQLLKSLTDAMHTAKPWSQVIWYDSVITNGQLKWQNALNQFNRPFFDNCDGIFLNYTWNDWMLASSKSLAGDSRATDVYVGIDVFGRGCYGGGGYNSSAALKMARKHGLSAAIFAPGWVFETQEKDKFIANQDKFWSLLEPHCDRRIVEGLPLVSSFCRGFGKQVAVDGKVVHTGQWTNHSAQDFQLVFNKDMFELGIKESLLINTVEVSAEMAYNNSSSLSVVGKVFKYGVSSRTIIRLFTMEANFSKPLLVAYTYSLTTPGSLLHSLQLHTNKAPRYIILDPSASTCEEASDEADSVNQQLLTKYGLVRSCEHQVAGMSGIDQSNYVCFAPLPSPYAQFLHKKFTGHEDLTTGKWTTSYFFVTSKALSTALVREVRLVCEPPADSIPNDNNFSLNIGEIKVLNPKCISFSYIHASVSHLTCCDVLCSQKDLMLSTTLHWQLHQNNPIDPTLHYNIYHKFNQNKSSSPLFTGRAFSTHYRITNLKLPKTFEEGKHSEVVFYIQSVSQCGKKLPVLDCPSLAMNWD